MQETNSFSPVRTTLRDFEALGICYGQEVLDVVREQRMSTIGGFVKASERPGGPTVELVPILSATAMSGGPIDPAVYQRFKRELVAGLIDARPLDGIYLSLHGAMGVDGLRDPEADLLKAIRDDFGTDIPIGVSLDLHANITAAKTKQATFIVGYKTNPHRDFYDTGVRCFHILTDTILGRVQPVMVARKMRLLKGGGMTIDFLSPMRRIFRTMQEYERQDHVLDVSNFMVHPWLDDPELGWTTVVTTDANRHLAEEIALHIAELNWAVRDADHPQPLSAHEAIRMARSSVVARLLGTVVVCDLSDAVGAGAPGESTWILQALLAEGADLTTYIPLRDAQATRLAYGAEIGERVRLSVGGKLDKRYNQAIDIEGDVTFKTVGKLGRTVVVRDRGIHLVLTELPAMTMMPRFFLDLGLRPGRADVVVVKNIFPFRFWFAPYNRKTLNVATPGTTNIDVFQIEYQNIPRPIYPLDNLASWQPP